MSPRTRRITAALVGALLLLPALAFATERLVAVDPEGDGTLVVLLMGSDQGPPRDELPTEGRADAIQLLFVSAERDAATFVSIPRDSWLDVPGFGETKVNACLTRGADNCVDTLEEAFGIEIAGWMVTSMWGMADAVNEFAGCPSGPEDCDRGLVVNVDFTCSSQCGGLPIAERGEQRLNGYEALTYARYRKGREGGDFGRSQGQAELLAIAHREVAEDGSVARMMDALRILRRHTVTSFTMPQLVRLGIDALRVDPATVQRQLIPSTTATIGAASAVRLLDGAYPMVDDAYDDGVLNGSAPGSVAP
jgi:LCP family protein required for cell wall assembly